MSEEEIDLSPDKDKGVLKKIITPGVGIACPKKGDRVSVRYIGRLVDGTIFDSSEQHGELYDFILGRGEVIRGWDIGVATMKKGEIAQLTCKSDYAYGENGSLPYVPGNADLIFEVTVLDWEGKDLTKDHDRGLVKYITKEGMGDELPKEGATLTIRYKAFHKEVEFESQEVTFTQGEGSVNVIRGLEMAAMTMKKGEKAKLHVSAKYAYGANGYKDKNIPANAELLYEVEMLLIENDDEIWKMNSKERLEFCRNTKEKGNDFLKKEDYNEAVRLYRKVESALDNQDLKWDHKSERDSLLLAAYLNLALCYQKTKSYFEAERSCNSALEIDVKNVKALFRRGQARMEQKEYGNAIKDFEKVLELEPENKAAKNNVTKCMNEKKQSIQKEKQIYTRMFQSSSTSKGDEFKPNQVTEYGEWNNDMADGMMPLQEEKAAFEDDDGKA